MTVATQSTIEVNKAVITGFIRVINDREPDRLGEFMAADVVDHNKIVYGEADEPGAAFDGIRQQLAALNPWGMIVEELIAENDRVVARVRQRGVLSGAHPRMPQPTGRSFDTELIMVFTLADGMITEIRAVSDRLGWMIQTGVLTGLED
ncbi:ester cyclase [Solihabitans fulvus]|uniref:Ester cyclase n=1 Tax=Solihabitans fulvus TaxID=1892852 RepID=A0A5B2WXL5_9PSEU|nr:ester cyclase [Solihabitans fulvus]KAA2255640.1 ester cyclase [Solihabitans fulvus]